MKLIREYNDFNWVSEQPINPWVEYDFIIFDIRPTREEINYYIELALNTRTDIENKSSWDTGRQGDIDKILKYMGKDGSYLGITRYKNLSYGSVTSYNYVYNEIQYSKLLNY